MYHFSSSISATTISSWLLKVRLISIVNFNTINIGWNKELPLLLLFFRELQFTSYLENYNLQFTPKSKKTSIYSYFLLRQKINASTVLHICSHLLNENGGKLRFPHFWEVNWKLFFYLGDELKFTLLFTCYSKLPTLFTGFFLLSLSVEFSVFIQFTNLSLKYHFTVLSGCMRKHEHWGPRDNSSCLFWESFPSPKAKVLCLWQCGRFLYTFSDVFWRRKGAPYIWHVHQNHGTMFCDLRPSNLSASCWTGPLIQMPCLSKLWPWKLRVRILIYAVLGWSTVFMVNVNDNLPVCYFEKIV